VQVSVAGRNAGLAIRGWLRQPSPRSKPGCTGVMDADDARDANCRLLSALRRAERRTRLPATALNFPEF
jgi:hypothetical protein